MMRWLMNLQSMAFGTETGTTEFFLHIKEEKHGKVKGVQSDDYDKDKDKDAQRSRGRRLTRY